MITGDVNSKCDDLALKVLLSDGACGIQALRSFVGTRIFVPSITAYATLATIYLVLMLKKTGQTDVSKHNVVHS